MNYLHNMNAACDRVSNISKAHHGRWLVVPTNKNHLNNMVVECVDKKFRDMSVYITVEVALEGADALICSLLDERPCNKISEEGLAFLDQLDLGLTQMEQLK